MISYWIRKVGDRMELERREEPLPHLEGDEMLVRMKASSFNRGDIMGRIRRHSADVPRPAGADGAGEVVDPGKSGFKRGIVSSSVVAAVLRNIRKSIQVSHG